MPVAYHLPTRPETLRRRADEKRATARRLENEADALDMEADEIEEARVKSTD